MSKFGCIQNHIIRFLREYRIIGVENKKCSAGIHTMRIGENTYVYNGEPFGLKSAFCLDLECFLGNLDKITVQKYIKQTKRKKEDKP
jgi:hypothetical protein